MIKTHLKKTLFVFICLNLLFQSIYPPIALAKQLDSLDALLESTASATSNPEPTRSSTVEPTLTPAVTAIPTTTPTPETTPTPTGEDTIESTSGPESLNQAWTFTDLQINTPYTAPQNDKVKITFTKLPENSGNLRIEEIKLSSDQIVALGSVTDTAYDITSDMVDGSFEYDLDLPVPGPETNVDVEYTSSPDEPTSKISQEKDMNSNIITIKGLNHFTLFIVVLNDDPPPVTKLEGVINNGDPEYSEVGEWSNAGSCAPNAYNSDGRYATNTGGIKTATWLFTVPVSGYYSVDFSWIKYSTRATNARYTVSHAEGSTEKIVDQKQGKNCDWSGFIGQGIYRFEQGVTYSVTLTNEGADGIVFADAIRVLSVNSPAEVWVDDDYGEGLPNDGHYFGFDAFSDITSALDSVSSDGIVNVASGTYDGNISIPSGLNGVDIRGSAGAILVGTFSNSLNDGIIISGFEVKGDDTYEGANLSDLTDSVISDNDFSGQGNSTLVLSGDFTGTEIKYNDFYLNSDYLITYLTSPLALTYNYWGTGAKPDQTHITNLPGESGEVFGTNTDLWLVASKNKGDVFETGYNFQSDNGDLKITQGEGSTANLYVAEYESAPFGGLTGSLASVGSYYEIVSENGSIAYPLRVEIKYSTPLPDGVVESELKGLYYHDDSGWHLYSDTGVDTANKIIWANADHLTPIVAGAEQDTTPPSTPTGIRIYKGHASDSSKLIPADGYTNDTKIRIEWDANTEPDIDYYWFGTKSNAHHKKVYGTYYDGNMTPGNNPYYYKVSAVDKSGNESLVSTSYQITLDTTPPLKPSGLKRTTPNGSAEYQCGAIVKRQTLIPVWNSVSSGDSSFDHYEYASFKPDGNIGTEKNLYVNRFDHNWVPTEDGTNGFAVRSVDKAGNSSEWALSGKSLAGSCQVTYDSTAPIASISYTTTLPTKNNVTATLHPSEPVTITSEGASSDHLFTANGSFTFTFVDAAGNSGSAVATVTNIDKVNPTKPESIGFKNPDLSCGSFTNFRTVTVDWSDSTDNVGVSGYDYLIDYPLVGGTGRSSWQTSFTQSQYRGTLNEGLHRIKVRAKDTAGNVSDWTYLCDITYDSVSPSFQSKTNFSGYYRTPQVSQFTYSDLNGIVSGSDVSCEIASEGENQTCAVTPKVCDPAGNCNTTQVISNPANLDFTDPLSEITYPINEGTDSVIYTSDWDGLVSGTASDYLSGVQKVDISIERISDGTYWNGQSWIELTEGGMEPRVTATGTSDWEYLLSDTPEDSYQIISHATDIAGNIEDSYKLIIVLDKTIPEVELSINPTDPDSGNGWYKTQPEITLTAKDKHFEKIEYQWDSRVNGKWVDYSLPIKVISEGAHVLYYRALDKAGNYSDTGIKNIRWDQSEVIKGPQNMNISPNPTSGTDASVTWQAGEDAVGLNRYEVKWSLIGGSISYSAGVNTQTFSYTIDKLTEGRWEVTVDAVDGAGNRKGVSQTLVVDRTSPAAPTLTLTDTGIGTASLSWNNIDDAADYIIWYGTVSGERLFGARTGDVTSFTVRGLGAGSYFFVIRSVDAAQNQSGESNEVSTGAIAGTPGIEPGQPAEDFTPEVRGANTDAIPSPTPTQEITPSVLGESTEDDWFTWQWLLLLLPLPIIFYYFGRKR